MDLLEILLDEPKIQEYLRDYPESEWFSLIKKTLLIGVNSLKACQDSGLVRPKAEGTRSRSSIRPKSQKFISVVKSSKKTPKSSMKRSRKSSTRNKKRVYTNENEETPMSQDSPQQSVIGNSREFTFKLFSGMKQVFHKEFSKLMPNI